MNQYYALRTPEETAAFLRFPEVQGTSLRRNYLEIVLATEEQLLKGISLRRLMGTLDEPKAKSSLVHFYDVAGTMGDTEVRDACDRVLRLVEKG